MVPSLNKHHPPFQVTNLQRTVKIQSLEKMSQGKRKYKEYLRRVVKGVPARSLRRLKREKGGGIEEEDGQLLEGD